MTKSIADAVREGLDSIELETLKNRNAKREFIDRLAKESGANPRSIEGIFYRELPKRLAAQGLNPDEFRTPKTKRFTEKKFAKVKTQPKEVSDEDGPQQQPEGGGAAAGGQPAARIRARNPTLRGPDGSIENPVIDETMLPIISTFDYGFKGIFSHYRLLNADERRAAAHNLNMAFGPYISEHEKTRMLIGIFGLITVFGGRLKEAYQEGAAEKRRERRAEQAMATAFEGTVETPEARAAYEQAAADFFKRPAEPEATEPGAAGSPAANLVPPPPVNAAVANSKYGEREIGPEV